jgi:hypothetical protein
MTLQTPVVRDELGKPVKALPVLSVGVDGTLGGATVVVTPTVSASPDYSSGDSIGGLMTVDGIVGANGAGGLLAYITAVSKASVGADIDLIVFNANPSASTFTDNAAVSIDAADLGKIIGKVTLTSAAWVALSGTQVLQAITTAVPINGQAAKAIYIAAVARGAINLASTSDLSFRFSAR